MNVSHNILRIRESLGRNKNDCAVEAGVSWHRWDGWEHGRGPSTGKLPIIANVLCCEIAELFKEPKEDHP